MPALRNPARIVVLFAVFGVLPFAGAPATAQTLLNSYNIQFPPPPPAPFMAQAFGDISFVRDGTVTAGKYVGKVVFTSNNYPIADLPSASISTIDSNFLVCYGGGYVSPLAAASAAGVSIASYTITASTAWYQTNANLDSVAAAPPARSLSNFANAWRNAVVAAPGGGMIAYYNTAQQNAPFTPPSPPKAIPGGIAWINYSIFASPDAAAGGANNTRVLGDVNLGMANQQRQFAILVQWARPELRFTANILRMYDLLTRVLGVPADRIAILFSNPNPATIGPIAGPIGPNNADPNGLLPPAIAGGPLRMARVNGPNTKASWTEALAGRYFLGANGRPIAPVAGDKLFIFHTGHGSSYSQKLGNVKVIPTGVEIDVSLNDQYNLNTTGDPTIDSSAVDIASDGNYTQTLQFSFGQMLPAGTEFILDGTDLGPLDSDFLDSAEALPISPFITQPTYAYQITVPESTFTDPENIAFQFTNSAAPTDAALSSLIAWDIMGGDQELLQQVVPGPDIAVSSGTAALHDGALVIPLKISNTGGTTADDTTISSVTAVAPAEFESPTLPIALGNIAPGATVARNIDVDVSGLKAGTVVHVQIAGSYQDGAGDNYQFATVRGAEVP